MAGGASALPAVVPGIGTAIAVSGGVATDATVCMKLQVDMCMCLAETYNYNLENEAARYLSFLIAGGGTIQKLGSTTGVRIASHAGVRMLRMYLKGATLMTIREIFKRVGITFTRKALEKALPFGAGVAISCGSNYALTRFVGHEAKTWFILDRSIPKKAKSKTKRKVKASQPAA